MTRSTGSLSRRGTGTTAATCSRPDSIGPLSRPCWIFWELEEISWLETDRSAFAEIAHIFDDVAHAAQAGATAMRLMAGEHEAPAANND